VMEWCRRLRFDLSVWLDFDGYGSDCVCMRILDLRCGSDVFFLIAEFFD